MIHTFNLKALFLLHKGNHGAMTRLIAVFAYKQAFGSGISMSMETNSTVKRHYLMVQLTDGNSAQWATQIHWRMPKRLGKLYVNFQCKKIQFVHKVRRRNKKFSPEVNGENPHAHALMR